MEGFLLDKLFDSQSTYLGLGYHVGGDAQLKTKLRGNAIYVIVKNANAMREGPDALVGYQALNLFDRLISQVHDLKELKNIKLIALSCFTLSLRRSGIDIRPIIRFNQIDVGALENKENWVARQLQWNLECPIMEFLQCFWETLPGDQKAVLPLCWIKNIIMSSMECVDFTRFPMSMIASGAILAANQENLDHRIGLPIQRLPRAEMGVVWDCAEKMRQNCDVGYYRLVPSQSADTCRLSGKFGMSINWGPGDQAAKRKWIARLRGLFHA